MPAFPRACFALVMSFIVPLSEFVSQVSVEGDVAKIMEAFVPEAMPVLFLTSAKIILAIPTILCEHIHLADSAFRCELV